MVAAVGALEADEMVGRGLHVEDQHARRGGISIFQFLRSVASSGCRGDGEVDGAVGIGLDPERPSKSSTRSRRRVPRRGDQLRSADLPASREEAPTSSWCGSLAVMKMNFEIGSFRRR